MLEYFTYKKYKKHKAEKEKQNPKTASPGPSAAGTPSAQPPPSASPAPPALPALPTLPKPPVETRVLDEDDEEFLQRITSPEAGDDDDYRPPLPPRVKTPDIGWDSDSASVKHLRADGGKDKQDPSASTSGKKGSRLSIFGRKSKKEGLNQTHLAVPEPEADRERDDLTRVLDDLNLAARNNKAFSLSSESSELVRKFTLVLKDLVNGVPTAVGDLKALLDDRDGTLARNFEKLPGSMKKLVTQLPTKLTSTLGPELMAVAAEAQGLGKDDAAKSGGLKGMAKKLLVPKNLQDLVTKPGAIVGMLKAIMNALKVRWPAFVGTNVIWSVAIFLLLFVLWYCHKRGREVRLEKERVVDGKDRVEELPDDPALPATATSSTGARTPIRMESNSGTPSPGHNLTLPPTEARASGRLSPVSQANKAAQRAG